MTAEQRTRLNLISGFLGVGKTTAIRHLARLRPQDETWAILVNEFGLIGIDGSMLRQSGELEDVDVAELPGGCICCTSRLPFQDSVARILDGIKPQRLIIEPTGMAESGRLIASLREPRFDDQLELCATITLVDPRRYLDPAQRNNTIFAGQLDAADVLVANRCDLASAAQLDAFIADASALQPAKQLVTTTTFGRIEVAWLDLAAEAALEGKTRIVTDHTHHTDAVEQEVTADPDGITRRLGGDDEIATCGWIFPARETFRRDHLERVLGLLLNHSALLPQGCIRLKGIFRLERGPASVNASADAIDWHPLAEAGDSRVELIVEATPTPNWPAIEAALLSTTRPMPR